MIFDGTIDDFQKHYGIYSIQTCTNPIFIKGTGEWHYYSSLSNMNVDIKMQGAGFKKMMRDLASPTFEIEKPDVADSALWVVKFDMNRHNLDTIEALAKKLMSGFPDKTIIFIPKDINIETMKAEEIAALRDRLNSVLESLNYDNIMEFNH